MTTVGAPPGSQPAQLWQQSRTILLVLILAILVLRAPSFVGQVFDPDETAISAQAIPLVNGGTMYEDAIDRKPPLPVFVYELSHRITGNTDLRLLHGLAAALLLAAALAIASEARRTMAKRIPDDPDAANRAAWWGGMLMVTSALAMTPVDGQATNYAHLALAPAALAMIGSRRGTRGWAFVCGFMLCIATLSRQTWAIGVFPATLAILRNGDWRKDLPTAIAGGLLPLAATALLVPWDDFYYWVFSSNDGFVFEGVDLTRAVTRGLGTLAIFVVGHSVVLWFTGRSFGTTRRTDPDLWLWLATGAVALTAGFRFWGHYWLQIVPALALVAAVELARKPRRTQERAAAVVGLTALLAVGLAWTPETVRTLPDPSPLASLVVDNTSPTDTVLIWGNFPEVLWEANRAPAGGLVHMDFITGRSGGREHGPHTIERAADRALPHLMDALMTNPPPLVIDTAPSGLRSYDLYPLELFPELDAFVQDNYTELTTVDGVVVYRCTTCSS